MSANQCLGQTHGADLFLWWAGKRYGATETEWADLKSWINDTLAKLVYGEAFSPEPGLKEYLLFGPDGKSAIVEDQYWGHLMSVIDAVSK